MFFTTLLVISLRTLLAWENKKLDRKFGTLEEQRQQKERVQGQAKEETAEENYGATFRYVL